MREYRVQMREYRVQMREYRVQMTELFALLIKLKQSDDRVQVTGER